MSCLYQIADIQIYSFPFHPIESNMYVVCCGNDVIVVDPICDEEAVALLKTFSIPLRILLTHEHYDHISGVNMLRSMFNCQIICSDKCADAIETPKKNLSQYFDALFCCQDEEIRKTISDMQVQPYSCHADLSFSTAYILSLNHHQVLLSVTPGHSKGSSCIAIDRLCLFSGDSVLAAPIVTKLPGGSRSDYYDKTIPYLYSLNVGITVFPGHGSPAPLNTLLSKICI